MTIVGAGPTGLCCALWLVRAGIRVTVLEREHGLPEDLRASTFHPATLDLLRDSGIADQLVGEGTRAPRWQYWRHGSEERIVFDLDLVAGETNYPFRLQCEQFRLTYAIACELRDHPLFALHRGCRVTAVQPEADGVALEYEDTGGLRRDRCSWLIAADGAHGAVRKSLGLAFEGSAFPRTSITLVLEDALQEQVPGLLPVNYVWTEDSHYSLLQLRDCWRFTYSPEPGQSVDEALGERAAQARIQGLFPRRPPYRIRHRNHYTIHQRCMDSFRHGHVLFAGDAAHLNSPSGGMGMNSGIHDAASLVEHLLPVLAGEDEALLDRYDRRRRTIAREEVQRLSARNHRRHRETDPERREAIWAELAATAADPERAREYLLESSMIASLRREKTID